MCAIPLHSSLLSLVNKSLRSKSESKYFNKPRGEIADTYDILILQSLAKPSHSWLGLNVLQPDVGRDHRIENQILFFICDTIDYITM